MRTPPRLPSNDLEATWASVLYNLEATNRMASVSQIGHYNDPDMLQVSTPFVCSSAYTLC